MKDKRQEQEYLAQVFIIYLAECLNIENEIKAKIKKPSLEYLKQTLKEYELTEQYEKCAIIRDKIKEIQ
jgi:protein-arginine kinase activator protein McsA